MNKFLLLLLLPCFLLSQKQKDFSVKYSNLTTPSTGEMSVIGTSEMKAVAIFVNETENTDKIFGEIKFKSTVFESKVATIYLTIYENNNGLPGTLINKERILLKIPAKRTEVILNLYAMKIQVPQNGYFMGFEWIQNKKNKILGNNSSDNTPYNPAIAGKFTKENLYIFNENHWQKSAKVAPFPSTLDLQINYKNF